MNTSYTTYPEKPALVNVIAWTTLASGIVNIGWGIVASATALLTIVGICCTPLTILPVILGIFEIIYAAKLLSTPPQVVRPATNLAILEIVCILTGNVFSMVVGIISLIFYNDPAVKDFFARLNGDLPPAPVPPAPQVPPVVPVTPAPVQEPIPSPITGETMESAEESPVSEPEPPSATDQTIISSPKTEGLEPPVPSSATDQTIISSATIEEPEPPSDPAMDRTIISSVKRDGVPEPPNAPDETYPSADPTKD